MTQVNPSRDASRLNPRSGARGRTGLSAPASVAGVVLLLMALTSCKPSAAQAEEAVQAYQGKSAPVTTEQLVPKMKGGEGYGQKYTFNAEYGERGRMYFSLTITNLGWGDHKMEAKGNLSLDGKKFSWKKSLDDDDWKYTKSPFTITAGPASLSGEPTRLVMSAKSGKDEFEATFTPIANPWRPRDGQIRFGPDKKINDYTVFPLMKVATRVRFDGGEWQEIEGYGYGTHSWSELAVYETARWLYEFRGISGDRTVYIRELNSTDEFGRKRVPYLLVTKGDQVLIESFDFQFTPTELLTDNEHENRYQVPESFTLLGADANEPDKRKFRGNVKKKNLRKRDDVLKSMGAATRAIVSRFSKPVLYDYDADYLIEVKNGDQTERIEGVGRYEVTWLNK